MCRVSVLTGGRFGVAGPVLLAFRLCWTLGSECNLVGLLPPFGLGGKRWPAPAPLYSPLRPELSPSVSALRPGLEGREVLKAREEAREESALH